MSAQPDADYPPYVVTLENKHRWDICVEAAEALFADLDPGERRTQVWSATRALYSSDIPTDLPPESQSEEEPA